MTRSYDRATYLGARAAWGDGAFGSEWAELRRLSWERGFPWPPSGSAHDDRNADEPSQRAIIHWTLVDNREAVIGIVGRSHSWSQVVDRIIGLEARLREDADLADRDAEFDRERRTTYREAVQSIAAIVHRIGELVP